jgi:hypothetical protein
MIDLILDKWSLNSASRRLSPTTVTLAWYDGAMRFQLTEKLVTA